MQSCRTSEAINAAFDQLQAELVVEIDEAKKSAREQILAMPRTTRSLNG